MIGNQIINNVVEFFFAMRRTFWRLLSSDRNSQKAQWEIDNNLFDFNTIVLIDEYLELGEKADACRRRTVSIRFFSHSIRFHHFVCRGISVSSLFSSARVNAHLFATDL